MANPQHVTIVKSGVAELSAWKENHPEVELDLSDAQLRDVDLEGADLSGSNLDNSDLSWANLKGARLDEASLKEAKLKNARLVEASLLGSDLTSAQLSSANLSCADLTGALLVGSQFYAANLSGANLTSANLTDARLRRAELDGANLSHAIISGALISSRQLLAASALPDEDQLPLLGPNDTGRDEWVAHAKARVDKKSGSQGPFDEPVYFDPNVYAEGGQIPVWYGTNRVPILSRPSPHKVLYSNDRDDRIHYGRCLIDIPKSMRIGGKRSLWTVAGSLLFGRSEHDQPTLRECTISSRTATLTEITSAIRKLDESERAGLVYIHGFSNDFESAAIRTAQIAFDIKMPGITAFYSWPSLGAPYAYAADEAALAASESFLRDFLIDFACETEISRLDVIAHSMGGRGFLRVAPQVVKAIEDRGGAPLGQVVFAAPDVDSDVFRRDTVGWLDEVKRATLYVHRKDKPLAVSGLLHAYHRAGYAPPVTVIPRADTVDTTRVDLSLLGHSGHASARPVLADIHELVWDDRPPSRRTGLRAAAEGGEKYWQIRL